MRRTWARRCLPVTTLAVALVLASCSSPSSTPEPPSANDGIVMNRPVPAAIDAIPLTTQNGDTVTLASLRGRTVMVVPFMTLCSDVCPMTTGNVLQVARTLRHDGASSKVAIVELSVDPGRDTVSRLAAYARIADVSWDLTTESPEDLAQLAKYFGLYYQQVPEDDPPDIDWLTGKPLTYDIAHSDGYLLIDPQGHEVFANDAAPGFHGKLPSRLRTFLSAEGVDHLTNPPRPDWTPDDALAALAWTIGTPLPGPAG